MDYIRIQTEILNEIEWRVKELTIIKTLPLKRNLNRNEKGLLTKFAIPNIYAIWEGYVKTSFRTYINELNTLGLTYNEIHGNILNHFLDVKHPQLTTGIKNDFEYKCSFFDKFVNNLFATITIESKLPTESNINLKVLNLLLKRFNLEPFEIIPYKSKLDNLLRIRNSVAHGETSVPITQEIIDENIRNVTDMMDDLMFKILQGCQLETYKRILTST